MAQLRIVMAQDPEVLLRHAATGFLERRIASAAEPFPTVPYLLAVRQGGVRDDVLEIAAAAGVPGWFDPPLCTFAELPGWLSAPARTPLGDFDRPVLLTQILRARGSPLFLDLQHPDEFVDAVDRLFGDLIADGVSPDRFVLALDARDGRDTFERDRDVALAKAYRTYLDELARLGRSDGRDGLLHCARAIESGAADLATSLRGRRAIRIFGLQDLRRGWRHLVSALASSPALDEVVIYTGTDLGIDIPGAIVESLVEPDSVAAHLFAEPPVRVEGAASLIVAPDVGREMDEVARRVREAIEGGVPPHRIAVVARQTRPALDRAVASLARFGVPATARQRVTLIEIPVVRAIHSLFAAAADGWTRAGLAALAEQPYLDCGLSPEIVNEIGYRRRVTGLDAWQRALEQLEAEAERRDRRDASGSRDDERRRPLPPTARVRATREQMRAFAERVERLNEPRSLRWWLRWLDEFLARDPWVVRRRIHKVPDREFEIARLDLAGWNGLRGLVAQWLGALTTFDAGTETKSVSEFAAELRVALGADVALWTTTKRGVQVLESFAAAYRSFDRVFIVGLEAGAFPRALPRSPLFSDEERAGLQAAGLPIEVRATWDRREQDLFRVLTAGARALTLSYSRLDKSGSEVIRSTFVEELGDVVALQETEIPASTVLVPGTPMYQSEPALAKAAHAARIERDRLAHIPSPYSGQITDPELVTAMGEEFGDAKVWSPTQLEEFAKCPWAYFSKRLLHLEQLEDPAQEMEPTVRGSILHDALQRFYDSARAKVKGPVFLRAADRPWAEPMLAAALDEAFADAEEREWMGHPSLRDARRQELGRLLHGFVAWEIQLHEDMFDSRKRNAPKMIQTGVSESEKRFDDMVYEADGVRLRYRGYIDRVEVSVDPRLPSEKFIVASDYKSTRYSTPGAGEPGAWDDGVVLQVPLYAHALSTLWPDHEVARVDYLALKKPDAVLQLQFYTYDKKARQSTRDAKAVQQYERALGAAIAHVQDARAGRFPARVTERTGTCPPWCHGRDICRIPGGPVESGW